MMDNVVAVLPLLIDENSELLSLKSPNLFFFGWKLRLGHLIVIAVVVM